jgi:hypothetical protein
MDQPVNPLTEERIHMGEKSSDLLISVERTKSINLQKPAERINLQRNRWYM